MESTSNSASGSASPPARSFSDDAITRIARLVCRQSDAATWVHTISQLAAEADILCGSSGVDLGMILFAGTERALMESQSYGARYSFHEVDFYLNRVLPQVKLALEVESSPLLPAVSAVLQRRWEKKVVDRLADLISQRVSTNEVHCRIEESLLEAANAGYAAFDVPSTVRRAIALSELRSGTAKDSDHRYYVYQLNLALSL